MPHLRGRRQIQRVGELVARCDTELPVAAAKVGRNRLRGDEEGLCDVSVRAALGGEPSDSKLAWRESFHAAKTSAAPAANSSACTRSMRGTAPQRAAISSASRSGSRDSTRCPRRLRVLPRSARDRARSSGAGHPSKAVTDARSKSTEFPRSCPARVRRAMPIALGIPERRAFARFSCASCRASSGQSWINADASEARQW